MFDNIPKPVINMLVQMLKNAAPELVPQLEQVADVVISFKAQADRIEVNQRLIMTHLGLTENDNDGKSEHGNGSFRQIGNGVESNSGTTRKTGTALARNPG